MKRTIECGKHVFHLGNNTLIMGILNVTPDSFSNGGKFLSVENALMQAKRMTEDGADIIDIGGESTRPGAERVPISKELQRVIPIIKKVSAQLDVSISIDTYKYPVAKEAIKAGACMVNDITALRGDKRMAGLIADKDLPIVLMHMKGSPRTMQRCPRYDDVIDEISDFLRERALFAISQGIEKDKIIIDPGIGFGKRLVDNLDIICSIRLFRKLGYPILAGPSRKSFIGAILNLPPEERLEGTLAAVTACILNGVDIVRVHDVLATKRAASIADAIKGKSL